MKTSKKFLCSCLCYCLVLLLGSCFNNNQEPPEVNNTITTVINGTSVVTYNDGICITVSPTTVNVGEEITIVVSHKKDKEIAAKIYSESLNWRNNIVTPDTIVQKIETEGIHDINVQFMEQYLVTIGTTITAK